MRYNIWCLNRTLWFYVPFENFLIIWRWHHYRWRASYFELYSALVVIEQGGFLSVSHLLWHGVSIYNGYLRGPVTLTPVAERGGLSRLRFEHPTSRKGGERSNGLRHRRGLNRTRQRVDTYRKPGTLVFLDIRVWESVKSLPIYPKYKFWIDFIYWLCNNANTIFLAGFFNETFG